MRRLAHFSLYHPQGEVDSAVVYFLEQLSEFCDEIIISSNGPLSPAAVKITEKLASAVYVRPNEGLDVEAHREYINRVGFDYISSFGEFLILNHTCFGPIFPFSELFTEMDKRSSDIWGVMAHKEMVPNPFTGVGSMPFHINANFVVFRSTITSSNAFRDYWTQLPKISSYNEAVHIHESVLTKYFTDRGFSVSTYVDGEKYGSRYPGMFDIDETIVGRNPLLKRRAFFHEPRYLECEGMDLPRALRLIRDTSPYAMNMIWENIARAGELRFLNTNAALTFPLPTFPNPKNRPKSIGKIALCVHVYYVDMMEEILSYGANIPVKYDLIITTDTKAKKDEIELILNNAGKTYDKVFVVQMEQNRGRDMAALFISCRDFFLSDDYALVCRIHTKKSPQVVATKGNLFKRHLLDNLLYSKGYVSNVIDLFAKNPYLGIAVPPLVNISYNHFGHAWYANKERVTDLFRHFGLKTLPDSETPIAIFGTMFWFRPAAIRQIFDYQWRWEDFNAEPHHVDGGLAHALERFACYMAQDNGYLTFQIMTTDYAGQNYASLEYKLQKLLSALPLAEFNRQYDLVAAWKASGYPLDHTRVDTPLSLPIPAPTVAEATRGFFRALRRSIIYRHPVLAVRLRPAYRAVRKILRV